MEVDNPLPRAFVLLGFALPLVAWAGVGLAARVSADRTTRRVIAPALALSLWLVAVCSLARLAHGFLFGFAAGTLLVAAYGATHAAAWLRTGARLRLPRPTWPLVVFTVVAVIAVMPVVRLYFADETGPTGHLSTICQLQNGHYPPRYSFLPRYEFRYHYGFDVLAAMVTGLVRCSPADAIDVCSVVLWAYTAVVAAHLGRCLAGARHGVLTAAFAMFGGGFPFLCPTSKAPLGHQMTGWCIIGGIQLGTPTAANFFQHPFGLGIPLALAVLCVLADRRSGPRLGRYVGYGVLLVALYLGQVVLFLCLAATLAVSEGFAGRGLVPRRALRMGAVLAIVAASAWMLGAFLGAAHPYDVGSLLTWHLGLTETLKTTAEWELRFYALLLPLGLVGIALLRSERLAFALLAVGSLVTPNVVKYTRSWDIVKFFTVGGLVLSICGSVAVVRLVARASPGLWSRAWRGSVAAVLTVAAIAAGVAFHLSVWLKLKGRTSMDMTLAVLDPPDMAVIAYLRRHARPEELVFRTKAVSFAYDQLGGLHTPWLFNFDAYGFGPAQRDARERVMSTLPDALPPYVSEGIVWFVLADGDRTLQGAAAQWIADGRAEVVFQRPPLRVIRAKPAPTRP